jgi:hypothetical protein
MLYRRRRTDNLAWFLILLGKHSVFSPLIIILVVKFS